MPHFDWNEEKNALLKKVRKVSFENIVTAINEKKILDIIEHPNKKFYSNQKAYIIKIENYAYFVPFVEKQDVHFLKTIIPSRKMTKKYLKGGEKQHEILR
jgi:uncharacterized DUF497 family protein